MTGFSRVEGTEEGYSWAWELRSVNARSLDIRLRTPSGMDRLEASFRKAVAGQINRGNVSATLTVTRPSRKQEVSVNSEILGQLLTLSSELSNLENVSPPSVDGLLTVRGVLEVHEEEETTEQQGKLDSEVVVAFAQATTELVKNRIAEGERLTVTINGHLDEIEQCVQEMVGIAAAQPAAIAKRMREQVRALAAEVPALAEERLAQEVALLAVKADIREEIDRLAAHVEGARELLAGGSPVGRKLDFLCQEFNREANTVCSKSSDLNQTRVGLELKAVIERLREQIQNIE